MVNNNTLRKYASSNILPMIILVAIMYFIAGKLGIYTAIPGTYITPFWAPAGIALAAVLLLGYQVLPGIFLGVLFLDVIVLSGLAPQASLIEIGIVSFIIGLGAVLEAAFGAYLINYFIHQKNIFTNGLSTLTFLLCGAASCLINSSVGAISMVLSGLTKASFSLMWSTWTIGDITGIFVMTPLILIWIRPPQWRILRTYILEILVSIAAIIGITLLNKFYNPHYLYLFIFLVLWAAVRYGFYGATLANFVVSAVVVFDMINSHMSLSGESLNEVFLELSLFIMFMSGAVLILVAELNKSPPKNCQWEAAVNFMSISYKNKIRRWMKK